MPSFALQLLKLYAPLVGWVGTGWILGRILPPVIPNRLGKFLFWIGVPLSIIGFLRQADLSGPVWIAPIVAWAGILLGLAGVWLWLQWQVKWRPTATHHSAHPLQHTSTRGSLLLAGMVGNTGYLGFPIILSLVGVPYFGWAIFYDMGGTMFGAYGLGALLASRYGRGGGSVRALSSALLINPTLWSFPVGILLQPLALPTWLDRLLQGGAWTSLCLALLLIGMRLSQLSTWKHFRWVSISLAIKMLVVPLVLGILLTLFGLQGAPRLVMVLQMSMPPAFATLVLAEAFDLDREMTVTALAVGTVSLLLLLPLWLWLFPVG